ncbi:extensin family protein [Coralloluteibacterium stylophorae]|uniref:Extensin family protein n=1 Tax=Coralloluteibacterium stylophorae TaxID=1776034 RepID=A0A8J7VTF7_9GAMM|nr:extensin family protein [Coralloluteibacterium stylophorae]MBS7455846.1 extensin family protein [Coralloluteibacterium stylophorae]
MRTFLLLVLAVALGVLALMRGWIAIPDRLDPWAPLVLDEPPGPFTRWKLGRLEDDRQACARLLESSGFAAVAVDDRRGDDGCGWRNAVRIGPGSDPAVGSAFTLQCAAAGALALWEHQVLQPAARRRFGRGVRALEHYGSYACRNVYGRASGRRSQHATANAFDLAGVILDDGRRIRVAGDWDGGDEEAAFLREIHDGACGLFNGVLGPDYNRAHRDHFHLDRGGYRICR